MRAWLSACVMLLTGVSFVAAEPPKGPLSPEESLKHLVLGDPNLVVEIVAAEPEVIDPVAIQFDEHGRLWVVEMRDYPTGPQNAPPPLGGPNAKPLSRIKLLEDKDGDGRYETAHVFADNLLFATGVQPWDGGVIVTLSGEVAYFKDTDGDHKADFRETWFTGFSQGNTQLRANHPTFGPDGWIYIANGLRGGNVIAVKKNWPVAVRSPDPHVRTNENTKQNEKTNRSDVGVRATGVSHDPQNPVPVSLAGRDFKFDPLTGRYEAISGNGQFGMTFDAWGNRFVCDNRHPCRHVIFEEDFIRRCPHIAFPAVVNDVIPPDDKNRVFPLTSAWTTSNLHAGTFTASCGVTVYTGDWLPEDYRGNVFVCEPTGNLVQRAVLEPDGVTFKSHNPHERRTGGVSPLVDRNESEKKNETNATRGLTPPVRQDTQEFLASRDDWFRPVDLQNGPDGALYVVDMYRAVIEHPEWVPDELKNRPDTWLGSDKGRIYRIRPKGERPKFDLVALRSQPQSQISSENKNRWLQVTARRLLTSDPKIDLKSNIGRFPMFRALANVDYGERMGEIRMMMRVLDPESKYLADVTRQEKDQIQEILWSRMRISDPPVRFAALQACTATAITPTVIQSYLLEYVADDCNDPWVRQACVAVAGDHCALLLNEILQRGHGSFPPGFGDGETKLVRQLSEQVGARANDTDLNSCIGRLTQAVRSGEPGRDWDEFSAGLAGLIGLSQGLSRRGTSFDRLGIALSEKTRADLQAVSRVCGEHSKLEMAPAIARELAIRWLRFAEFDGALAHGAQLRGLAESVPEQSLRQVALESFSSFHRPEVTTWLLGRYSAETPTMRRAILSALVASKERQLALLGAIADGKIAATEIDPVRAKQLTDAKDEAVREKARQVLAAAAPASRQEVLAAYQPALTLKADPQRGREVFQKNCVTCHRVGDLGVNVAPDISDTRTKKPEQLLLDILDPNRAIDANYFAYAVVTKDGKTESGVIASESSNSITLKQPEGKTLTLLRSDIEELRNTGLSLMPVGVEKNINQQQMADLIFWLKNWRYLDGKVPATSLNGK